MQAASAEEDPIKKGIFLCRGITSVILSFLTFVCMLTAVIALSVDYGNILKSDEACSFKAAFGMFALSCCFVFALFMWNAINLCMMYFTDGCCTQCECYHMNVSLQFASFGMIMIGMIIYGAKQSDKISWPFWFILISAVLTLVNGIMWCMTQMMKRFIKSGANLAGGAAPMGGADVGGGFL